MADELLAEPVGASGPGVRRLAESGGLEVYQAILDLVQRCQSVVVPTLFEAVPLELLEESGDGAW